MSSDSSSAWFPLAELMRPQGRRGELLAEPLTDLPDIFRDGADVWIAKTAEPAGDAPAVQLESHWMPTGRNAGRVVVKLSAANSISEAESLEGQRLFLRAQDAPQLEDGTWFVRDLIGCTLLDRDTPAGTVTGVEFAMTPDGRTRIDDAAPLLVVERSPSADTETAETLVPFIRAWVREVDIANKRLLMDLPDGLLDSSTEA